MIPTIGVHEVDFPTYLGWEAVNASVLKYGNISAKHLRAAMLGAIEKEDTASMRFGRAFHCALLEGDDVRAARFPIAKTCEAMTKKHEPCGNQGQRLDNGKWYCGKHSNNEPCTDYVTESELERIGLMSASVRRHPVVKLLRKNGGHEVSMVAEVDGVLCKARLDKLVEKSGNFPACIIDVKKTAKGNIQTKDCQRAVLDYGYHIQAALQVRIAREVLKIEPAYFWIFVEDGAPYDCNVVQAADIDMRIGDLELQHLLRMVKQGLATDKWPGVCDDINEGGLPDWYVRQYEKAIGDAA